MAEWVMFDVAFSEIGGLPSAIFFGVSIYYKSLVKDIGLRW